MVKHENFKTCDQSGFCKRNRAYADNVASASGFKSPYELDSTSLTFEKGQLKGTILKTVASSPEQVRLPVIISFLESGSARVTIDEDKRQKGEIELRHDSKARKERYNELDKHVLVGGLMPSAGAALSSTAEKGTTAVSYGPAGKFEAVITHAPFSIEFKRDGQTHIKFNDRGFMNMEHWRQKVEQPKPEEGADAASTEAVAPPVSTEDESTWWEESFGGNTDTKPRGPESVGLDISFNGYDHVYGIPEHASALSLKETR